MNHQRTVLARERGEVIWTGGQTSSQGRSAALRFGILLFGCLPVLLPSGVLGEEPPKPAEEPPKLQARFYPQATPFSGEITRGILVAKESQFSFVLPPGFRQQVNAAERKISLTSTSYTCAITAKIFETSIDGQTDLKPDTLRTRVLSEYRDAKVVDEFSASIESMSGPAFEVEWFAESGQKMTTRAAFVPFAAGRIEFTVQAPTAEIRKYDQPLNQLLLSFRTGPVGKELAVQEFLSEL